jgi:hypothetical protein
VLCTKPCDMPLKTHWLRRAPTCWPMHPSDAGSAFDLKAAAPKALPESANWQQGGMAFERSDPSSFFNAPSLQAGRFCASPPGR